jgi:hypothetical protein
MNQRVAHQTWTRLYLRGLTATSRPERQILRVARRWLQQKVGKTALPVKDMDMLLRLQILEGAAGVGQPKRGGLWTRMSARRGLAKAKAFFEDAGVRLDPAWYSSRDEDVFQHLWDSASAFKRKNSIQRFSVDDIVQMLMGGIGFTSEQTDWVVPYGVGQSQAADIKSGKETPKTIVSFLINAAIKRLRSVGTVDSARSKKDRERAEEMGGSTTGPVGDDGEDQSAGRGVGRPTSERDEYEADESQIVLNALMLPGDALGRKLREVGKAIWNPRRRKGQVMLEWLRRVMNPSKDAPASVTSIGEALGMSTPETSKMLKGGFEDLRKAIEQSPKLSDEITLRAMQQQSTMRAANLKRAVRTKQGSIIPSGMKVAISYPPNRPRLALLQVLSTGEVFWARRAHLPSLVYRLS